MTSPLSQAQLSIFLASQGLDRFSGNYQQALLFKLPGHIELEKLKGALESLVSTHPYILSHPHRKRRTRHGGVRRAMDGRD